MASGKDFEKKVRTYAAIRFGLPFGPEHLVGINFDAVASLKPDYKVIVEATENFTLEKVRGDTARLAIAKQKMIGDGIYAECHLVLNREPTEFMKEAGTNFKINVVSFNNFYRAWYDTQSYISSRSSRPFGSAIREGKDGPDGRPYIPVVFSDADGNRYSIDDIRDKIATGSRIVLTGEFGTGKSRAIQQLFSALTPENPTERSPISIDLRQMWGTTSADEVIRRHFSTLQIGPQAESAIDALHHNEFFLLLDGFDELAIQEWGSDATSIATSRAKTMNPIRDLLSRSTNGALITGRAHYFNSDTEMLSALGLPSTTLILSTPPEFTTEEVSHFIKSMGYSGSLPLWLPKKPLIAEMFVDFTLNGLSAVGVTRPEFWEAFMNALCRRDAKIRQSYDPEAIKQILCRLSRSARIQSDGLGPIRPSDVQEAFTFVVGQFPAQEASSMLQRLPGLGRVASESDDRQFVDEFIVQGLRGLDVSNIVATYEPDVRADHWKFGAGELGLEVIASRLGGSFSIHDAISRIQSDQSGDSGPLCADILAGLLISDVEDIDFSGSSVSSGYISVLDFSGKRVSNLHLSSIEIDFLNIYNSRIEDVEIVDCTVAALDGASGEGIPGWIRDCLVGTQSQMDTVARIKRSQLKASEMILATILRKTFFQPGSGRKEEALIRGLGQFGDAKLQNKVLAILCNRSFLNKVQGDSGNLYVPERSKTPRARRMLAQLQQSGDDVWSEVSALVP